MGSYEYSNARLRAMKSRLLSHDHLQELAEIRFLDQLLRAMAQTDYREAIEATPVLAGELDAFNVALNRHLRLTFQMIRRFYDPQERHAVAIILQTYDVLNVKAILHGLEHNVPPESIRDAQLPIGDLSAPVLQLLTQAASWREALDLMASMRLPIARPLLGVRSSHPHAPVAQFELALDRWYFARALAACERLPGSAKLLGQALAIEADLVNLMTVLRILHAPADRAGTLAQLGGESIRDLLVGPGHLSWSLLDQSAQQGSVDSAVSLLETTRYGRPLKAGLESYRRAGRLSDLERRLRRYRLETYVRFMRVDPLGIGVFLGYLALKINEVGNLRWIAHGVDIGLPVQAVMDELELVA